VESELAAQIGEQVQKYRGIQPARVADAEVLAGRVALEK